MYLPSFVSYPCLENIRLESLLSSGMNFLTSRKGNTILELLRKGNIIAVSSTSIIRSEYSSS